MAGLGLTMMNAVTLSEVAEQRIVADVGDLALRMRRVEEWVAQCSKHLMHAEKRIMSSNFLMHEVVRQMGSFLTEVAPFGDALWPMRGIEDVCTNGVRRLVEVYKSDQVGMEATMLKAMRAMRLCLEEAVRRVLLNCSERRDLSAYCSLVSTTRRMEAMKKPDA